MAEERGGYQYAISWLTELGYSPDTRMTSTIKEYWGWFVAENDWYTYRVKRGTRFFSADRETLHPAALAAEAWSDLLMNEKLEIVSDDNSLQEVIEEHFTNFGVDQADFVTRSFGLGTGAWALSISGVSEDEHVNVHAEIEIVDYDANQIYPLTWSAKDCTQCAFVTRVEVNGKDYDQCQAHVIIDGTYHIITQLFDVKSHKKVEVEGVITDLDTHSEFKTFALVKPAVPNSHFSYCAMGASVFEKGISAIKATDEALTSLLVHLRVARPKMFVSENMIEKTKRKDGNGNTVTTYAAFGEANDIAFRTPPGDEGTDPLKVVQPKMCISENDAAINAGLKMLAMTCGLGDRYWAWDNATGVKTATEVVSDSSMLARTLKKYQNALSKSLKDIVRGVAGVCRGVCKTNVAPDADIRIDFDDSIITDTQTDKNMALSEISILGIPELKRRYLTNFCGFTKEEAGAAVPEDNVLVDEGY